jgi:ParB-like chromosome segregation protein Spo0J
MTRGEASTATPVIALRRVDELTPDPRNARTHSDAQIAEIAASVRRFGWTNPILADDVIRAGNGRRAAAVLIYAAGERIYLAPGQERGGAMLPEGTVPVIDCSGWSEDERLGYGLADNKIALNAGWDEAVLAESLRSLESVSFDMSVIGFDMGEVTLALAATGEPTDPAAEWDGMPEFDQQDKRAFRSIPVHFGSQEDVDRFAELIGQTITPQTRYIWYPETPIERYADKQYVDTGSDA